MRFNNTLISLEIKTPSDVALDIAKRVRMRRLELNLTQAGMAKRSGVKLPTYRKFEKTGIISLKGLLQIAVSLHTIDEFDNLFSRREYQHIEEVIQDVRVTRKRGKRND